MPATIEQRVKIEVREFKSDVNQLEKYVKQWEREFHLKEIGKSSESCYNACTNLQMSLAKLANKTEKSKIQLECYKDTRNLLAYFENEANTDVVVLLLNNCPPFARLFEYCNEYCSRVERDYGLELESEKAIRANEELVRRLKSLRNS